MKLCLMYHGVIYSKKNSKRIITNHRTRRPMIVSSERAKAMEQNMASQFSAQFNEIYRNYYLHPQPVETCQGKPLKVSVFIWEKDRTRRDLDNQATSILDALVEAGVIADDSVKVVQELNVRMMGIDKFDPHALVEIEGVDDYEPITTNKRKD
ncbi:RusA family crossover junction endodeoxyribonuclease [Candidatus Saccharibacteria bacterium]|nr:RusA family crossover junction endodeoxyribonuclease [Candidatus Saccharibacteria bacterium]